jgi:hypothetical protein
MAKKLHLGIGHYGIGFKDGVNTVISRNVRSLLEIDPDLKITLFGKLSPDYKDFIKPPPASLEYRDIGEFDPGVATKCLGARSISEQEVHDYIWQGTNMAEILVEKLADMDIIMIENLGIGIHPAVTYAFSLYTEYSFTREDKKFIYRFHDFAQQRPVNFRNVRKFYHPRFGIVPHWHSILYPAYPNIKYIAINRYDRQRLIEHGIEEGNIYYIPNSVDRSIIPSDERSGELRKKIIEGERLDPSVRFLLYPVRCVRRKNVEEAIFLTQFFNCLAEGRTSKKTSLPRGKFHLLVSVRPKEGDDAEYAKHLIEFVKEQNLPVTIGLDDFVALERELDPQDPAKIRRYGIGDLYRASDLVITTSILEGFGFVYIEPWIVDRAVIGRNIPVITPDFQAAGMKLGHLYTALLVEGKDFKDIGREKAHPDEALQERLPKILKLNDPSYVDKVIESNETPMLATLRLFHKERRGELVAKNKEVVEKVYSQERIGRQLYQLINSSIGFVAA